MERAVPQPRSAVRSGSSLGAASAVPQARRAAMGDAVPQARRAAIGDAVPQASAVIMGCAAARLAMFAAAGPSAKRRPRPEAVLVLLNPRRMARFVLVAERRTRIGRRVT